MSNHHAPNTNTSNTAPGGPNLELMGRRVRPETVTCAWCETTVPVAAKGRYPKWCSPICRRRGWEQRRALTSGRTAIEVIERMVMIEPPKPPVIRGWSYHKVDLETLPTTSTQWGQVLNELGKQLQERRIHRYPDLLALARSLTYLTEALNKAQQWSAPK